MAQQIKLRTCKSAYLTHFHSHNDRLIASYLWYEQVTVYDLLPRFPTPADWYAKLTQHERLLLQPPPPWLQDVSDTTPAEP